MLTDGGINCRVCAYMGLSGLMPENTLPSFAAAISFGVDEIEFDVRLTRDKKLVVINDPDLGKVSDRRGYVGEYDLETVLSMNAGSYKGWYVHFCTPEQVIKMFGGRIGMNIHINETGDNGFVVRELYRLLRAYDALDGAYFSARGDDLGVCREFAPRVPRCSLEPFSGDIVDYGAKYACKIVEFTKPHFTRQQIERAKKLGMKCSVCWADDHYEVRRMLDAGMDMILTGRPDVLSVMKPETNR